MTTRTTYTFGTTPEHVIREAFDREAFDDYYTIDARGIDAVTLQAAHTSDGLWTADELLTALDDLAGVQAHHAARAVRRSFGRYSSAEVLENAASLRCSILETLGIEEV